MGVRPRVHDLVRVDPDAFEDRSLPQWARTSLAATPWVVVRRAAPPEPELIAVGVRGAQRAERHATVLRREGARDVRSPESLLTTTPRRALPALDALAFVREAAAGLGIICGPGGSVGFELATGAPVASQTSDCDLVVRPAPHASLLRFADALATLGVRIDAIVEFPEGGIALGDYARGGTCLVRSADGPRAIAFHG